MAPDPDWLEKIRSIRAISRLSGDQVAEGRDTSGDRFKAVTDELNNTVTERSGDRQDVVIRAPNICVTSTTNERD